MSLSRIIRDSLRRGMRTFRRKKKTKGHDEVDAPLGEADAIFEKFLHSENFNEIRNLFTQLCGALNINSSNHSHLYDEIKNKIQTHGAKTLWRLLGKRMSQNVYGKGTNCTNKKVLIIGAGPCGLRMAVEAALLGAKVTVVEMRDYIARNNVLHLWPFVIHDLKALGARVFSPNFCSGSVEHVSIRRLQHILMKVSLLLGVEIFAPVSFQHVIPPGPDSTGQMKGWKASCSPENHVVNDYEFDMIVGADGKSNTLRDFKRKIFRGKLAIAITANFVNRKTKEEAAVPEIPGLFYIFNQQFFLKLKNEAAIDLENFVYFRDDTHYFVMTARKQSLLKRGVLKQDFPEVANLLGRDNIDRQNLLAYAKEAANLATDHKLPNLDFALNHRGQEDAAIFDFTSMHQAEHSSMMLERQGKKLLMSIVGDTLIEPFWPTGSGCARGFLSVFDTAWMLRSYGKPDKTPLELIAERESIFQLLSQTKPDNLSRHLSNYTIDPKTRYGTQINLQSVNPSQIRHLFVTSDTRLPSVSEVPQPKRYISRRKSGKSSAVRKLDTTRLLAWYQEKLKPYSDKVVVTDLTTSWRDGVALCCLIHLYRPEIIDLRGIHSDNPVGNNQLALGIIQQEFGIMPVQSPAELAREEGPDRLASLSYLTRLQDQLEKEPIPTAASGKESEVRVRLSKTRRRDVLKRKVSSVGMLLRLSKRRKKPEARLPTPQMEDYRANTRLLIPRMDRSPSRSPAQERRESWQDKRMNTLDKCKGLGIASKRITLFEQGVQPEDDLTIPDTRVPSTDCCICGKHLLVVERQSAHGYFFHRKCFRCATCCCSLWLGASSVRRGINDKVNFYCDRHDPAGAMASYDDVDAVFREEGADGAQMEVDETLNNGDPREAGASDESHVNDYVADMMKMMGMMGMNEAEWTPATAICDADISSSDIESDDEVMEEQTETPDQGGSLKKRFYNIATSMRLMVAHEIQQEFEEVQHEEEELQEEGKEMENTLRRKTIIEGVDKDKLTDEWIDVVKSKQDIQNHQSRLLLKARLLDLQTKFAGLERDLIGIQTTLDEHESMERAGQETEKLESELNDVFTELREIRMFLQETGETNV